MAKNRKNQSASVRFGPAVKAFVLCLFIGGSGVGYVWQKNQINALGNEISAAEKRLDELQVQNRRRAEQIAAACSPRNLDDRVKRMNLGLGPTQLSQVVRLAERPPENLSAPAERVAAQHLAQMLP